MERGCSPAWEWTVAGMFGWLSLPQPGSHPPGCMWVTKPCPSAFLAEGPAMFHADGILGNTLGKSEKHQLRGQGWRLWARQAWQAAGPPTLCEAIPSPLGGSAVLGPPHPRSSTRGIPQTTHKTPVPTLSPHLQSRAGLGHLCHHCAWRHARRAIYSSLPGQPTSWRTVGA